MEGQRFDSPLFIRNGEGLKYFESTVMPRVEQR